MADSYESDDSQAYFPKTRMITDLQKQVQKLNMRVEQSEKSDYDRYERKNERSHKVSREDRWRESSDDDKRKERRERRETCDRKKRKERKDERKESDRDIDWDIKEHKLQIPTFHGKSDVDGYLNWEMKIEQIFICYEIRDDKKLKLGTLEFQN